MMEGQYYQKYLKYKKKYIDLKESNVMSGGRRYDFFFVHATKSFETLLSTLDTGFIFSGKDVESKHRFMGGPETEFEHVYMSMYFKDIDNIKHIRAISLIIDSSLIYGNNLIFHEGWYGGNPIFLYKNDTKKIIDKKIEKIHKFLENPISVPEKLREGGMFDHQMLMEGSISLEKYVIGIAFNIQDVDLYRKDISKIKRKIKEKGYNMNIYYTDKPLNINL